MSFAKLAPLATIAVLATVGGMVVYSQTADDSSPTLSVLGPVDGSAAPVAATPPGPLVPKHTGPKVAVHPVRSLVPPEAWVVADFQGDLTGQKPFADQPGMCASVPAPPRVVMAVLPPLGGNSPDLLIAARTVEDTFWGCARDRIVRAGGTALAQNDRYEVLKSPTGVVARGPLGSMVFLSGDGHLEKALAVLSELDEGAATEGPHADLIQRMYAGGKPPADSVLDVTLAFPDDWLSSVGQDKEKTPLRFIHSAFVSSFSDGSAQGGIDCEEEGCAEVLTFLQRAQGDLTKDLPEKVSAALSASLKTEHVKGAGRIAINWDPSELPLAALLGQFFGAGAFGD